MRLLGLAATTLTLAAAPTALGATTTDFAHPIDSVERHVLAPHTTATFRMPVAGLGVDQNSLLPCWGYEVAGSGVSLVGADLPTTGLVFAEPAAAAQPDGGIPGARRQPDGSLRIAGPKPPTTFATTRGVACASIGWRFYTADGTPRLDEHGNPKASVVGARAASRSRARARKLRAALKRARAADNAPVEVLTAELNNEDPQGRPAILVTVRTRAIPAGTTLTTRASVLPQRVDPSARTPRPDAAR